MSKHDHSIAGFKALFSQLWQAGVHTVGAIKLTQGFPTHQASAGRGLGCPRPSKEAGAGADLLRPGGAESSLVNLLACTPTEIHQDAGRHPNFSREGLGAAPSGCSYPIS